MLSPTDLWEPATPGTALALASPGPRGQAGKESQGPRPPGPSVPRPSQPPKAEAGPTAPAHQGVTSQGPLVSGLQPGGCWDPLSRPPVPPRPPYLAEVPVGEAGQARTGWVAGAGAGGPAGAAPGPDAVAAAVEGPLVAGGGAGRSVAGAPRSGAEEAKPASQRPPAGAPPARQPLTQRLLREGLVWSFMWGLSSKES